MDYTIKNECLTLRVNALGGQMQSLKDASGHEYLWQGDDRMSCETAGK